MASGVKSAIVTGGAGFLGSYVCDRLVAEGTKVYCIDNFITGRRDNIAHLLGSALFEFIEHDVCDPFPDLKTDEIWNLACPASPPRYQADPVKTLLTSVMGTNHALKLALHHGGRVFQASTSEVYGDPDVHPQPETYRGSVNPHGPRACYDEGKRAAEALCFDYIRKYGSQVKVVRIFNTYGPRMNADDGRVVSNFVVAALEGKPLELYGDGKQTRSFCYVEDTVEGFFRLMRAPADVTGPINIGNPYEFSMRELAAIVQEMTGSKSIIDFKTLPVDDPKQRQPDISLAKNVLGWEPKTSLRDGLRLTIDHFRKQLKVMHAGEQA